MATWSPVANALQPRAFIPQMIDGQETTIAVLPCDRVKWLVCFHWRSPRDGDRSSQAVRRHRPFDQRERTIDGERERRGGERACEHEARVGEGES